MDNKIKKRIITMFSQWILKDYAPGEGKSLGAHEESFSDDTWIEIPVPGDVHRTLIDAGLIEDPFYDQNEISCTWIEDREWWYRTQFTGPDEPLQSSERLQLVFHGLDSFTTIWLNGQELGEHGNMFREAVFDITDQIRMGEQNTLAVCFHRPLDQVPQEGEFQPWGHNPERVYMRKAQFGFGWDWGPRLPTVGLWRPVELRRHELAAIRGVHFRTIEIDHAQNLAVVSVNIQVDRFATKDPLTADIVLSLGDFTTKAQLVINGNLATAYLQIENPRLWWTHDLGEPTLYDLTVSLNFDRRLIDEHKSCVGIRTIELDQSPDPDEPGTRFFRFLLNGVGIFARGANWIPADSFVGAIQPERYESLLKSALSANMNMLRIWGGGIYEHDVFYELCNRLGLLVWQDFMFACASYPEDESMSTEVEAEVRYQIRRLRNHPCIALWNGNNECQWIHDMYHWDKPGDPVPGALYYHKIMPQAISELDGSIPYWPGSPFGGNDHNSMADGNRHNWDVWHGNLPRRFGEMTQRDPTPGGISYQNYARDKGRFISEFGLHASPVFETLRRCLPDDQLYFHSPSMDHHIKDHPKNKGDKFMETVTGLPLDIESYIDYSMISQAEGLKFAIEHYRRRKPHCSGTIWWQFNDCWPVLSWSLVDYYGFKKAGYDYMRRVYNPVLASFKELDDGSVELWLTNDTQQSLLDEVTVHLGSFDGDVIWEENFSARIEANSSQSIQRWNSNQVEASAHHYLSVHSEGAIFPSNRLFFTAIKDLQLPVSQPDVIITPVDKHTLQVQLKAEVYTYFTHLIVNHEDTQYTDNYFDLQPGESRTVTVHNSVIPMTPDMVQVRWFNQGSD
jgi:beta-mannosidase